MTLEEPVRDGASGRKEWECEDGNGFEETSLDVEVLG